MSHAKQRLSLGVDTIFGHTSEKWGTQDSKIQLIIQILRIETTISPARTTVDLNAPCQCLALVLVVGVLQLLRLLSLAGKPSWGQLECGGFLKYSTVYQPFWGSIYGNPGFYHIHICRVGIGIARIKFLELWVVDHSAC